MTGFDALAPVVPALSRDLIDVVLRLIDRSLLLLSNRILRPRSLPRLSHSAASSGDGHTARCRGQGRRALQRQTGWTHHDIALAHPVTKHEAPRRAAKQDATLKHNLAVPQQFSRVTPMQCCEEKAATRSPIPALAQQPRRVTS
jgi:hypothetical protein